MQPHHNVKTLKLRGYQGDTIPIWPGRGDNSASFDFPNLVTLRIVNCSELLYLPWQIGKLPRLKTLEISGLPNMEYVADSETLVSNEGSSLFPYLDFLEISELPKLKGWWRRTESGSHVVNPSESYHGETIPRWPRRGDNSALFDFPNLVTLKIKNCSELLYLPWQIRKLPYLKTLHISRLLNMEYVADSETLVSDEGLSFFPSLDNLSIHELPKLKGWWRRSESGSHMVNSNDSRRSREGQVEWESSPCFPLLKILSIRNCGNMMFVPLCPQLEELIIYDSRADMRCAHRPLSCTKLKRLEINNLEWLKSMPIEYTQFLSEIEIVSDRRMERLGEVNEFPTSLLSSVRTLRIGICPKLVSIRGWLEHLSALEYLYIRDCPKVELGGMSWHNLAATLQHLELMKELPEGLQYCTSLKYLYIRNCPNLKSMPKWMPKLTSLQELIIGWCSRSLKERCQQPNGEDWPLVHHISRIDMW
ncbi:uncharacterized protein LOC141611112 isoform X1 [Silene latifolia]|uniref:uncharacterized protein LOC141611112 isoform X1 n=1 Tax=Silene latifolia TaxID=37657 RepID=UPI003D7724EF